MTRFIDVSLLLGPDLPTWPGSAGCVVERVSDVAAGDAVTSSVLHTDVHVGTHVDAPAHFIRDGAEISDIDLDDLIGPARVLDLDVHASIEIEDLEAAGFQRGMSRILLRTSNSRRFWDQPVARFDPDYAALSASAAGYLVSSEVRLVGIDYLSIQRFEDGPETHQVLLDAGVVIVEGLDLRHAPAGDYGLICLPLRLQGAEGAPARVLLEMMDSSSR